METEQKTKACACVCRGVSHKALCITSSSLLRARKERIRNIYSLHCLQRVLKSVGQILLVMGVMASDRHAQGSILQI